MFGGVVGTLLLRVTVLGTGPRGRSRTLWWQSVSDVGGHVPGVGRGRPGVTLVGEAKDH